MLLKDKNANFEEFAVDKTPGLRNKMIKRSGGKTVPQIFIQGKHIGGCDELYALERQGKLDQLLSQ